MMANRRMFSKDIIDSDQFLDMSGNTQLLYFHLCMRADDDGFVNNPKTIMRMIGANDDDLKVLAIKKYVIPFETGIIVIKHWHLHNYIQKDRYKETNYKDEKTKLFLDKNKSYSVNEQCTQNVSKMETQVRLGKVRLGKVKDKDIKEGVQGEKDKKNKTKQIPLPKKKYGEHVSLTDKENNSLVNKYGKQAAQSMIEILDNYKGAHGKKYKSDYRAILMWVVKKYNQDQMDSKFKESWQDQQKREVLEEIERRKNRKNRKE